MKKLNDKKLLAENKRLKAVITQLIKEAEQGLVVSKTIKRAKALIG